MVIVKTHSLCSIIDTHSTFWKNSNISKDCSDGAGWGSFMQK